MPRKQRIDYEGAWHHVMNRGLGRAQIFDARTAKIFLIEVRDACARHRIEVHGYCVLPNHYHLLVHTPCGGLSPGMQMLSSRFTQAVNRLRRRDGPLFKGRFRSVPIEDDAHLVQVSRYIHLNPVEARLAAKAEDWSWSSAAAYLSLAERPEWLHVDTLLTMFGTANATTAYAQYLREADDGSDTSRQP
jgi:putative transposase